MTFIMIYANLRITGKIDPFYERIYHENPFEREGFLISIK